MFSKYVLDFSFAFFLYVLDQTEEIIFKYPHKKLKKK